MVMGSQESFEHGSAYSYFIPVGSFWLMNK